MFESLKWQLRLLTRSLKCPYWIKWIKIFSHRDVNTFEVPSAFLLRMIDLCLLWDELSCTWDTSVNLWCSGQSPYSTSLFGLNSLQQLSFYSVVMYVCKCVSTFVFFFICTWCQVFDALIEGRYVSSLLITSPLSGFQEERRLLLLDQLSFSGKDKDR